MYLSVCSQLGLTSSRKLSWFPWHASAAPPGPCHPTMGPCLAGSFVYRNCTEGPADKDCLLRGCYLGDETMVVTIVRFVMKTQMCVRSGLQEGVPGGGQIQTRPHIPQRLVKRWGCVTIGPQMSLLGGRIGRPGPLSPGETSGRNGQILSFRRQTFHSGIEQRHLAPGPRMLPRLFLGLP